MKNVIVLSLIGLICIGSGILKADEVTEWNTAVLDMIKADGISNHFGNRSTAMLHIAIYDAVNSIHGTYEPFLSIYKAGTSLPDQAVAAGAAFEVISNLYPQKIDLFQPL